MVKLDRLIWKIKDVTMLQWDAFDYDLRWYDFYGHCDVVRYEVGKGASDYHYQRHVGKGEGAIFIGFKHNMSLNVGKWDIKVELNPQKADKHQLIIELLQLHFRNHAKVVTLMDLAVDVEVSTKDILVLPKYAREENRYRGDRFFGDRSKHGYLKVYDKKRERKEKAKIEIPQDVLTRIEYTIRTDVDGIPIQHLRKLYPDPEHEYTIYLVNQGLGDIDVMVDCAVYAILNGYKQYKDFGRYQKEKIKKALKQFQILNLGELFRANWEDIVDTARKYVVDYSISLNESNYNSIYQI